MIKLNMGLNRQGFSFINKNFCCIYTFFSEERIFRCFVLNVVIR